MSSTKKKQINNSKYIKEIHKTLIDNQGRRKYFRELNPILQDDPIYIDPKSIERKKKFYSFCLIFVGLMKMLMQHGI